MTTTTLRRIPLLLAALLLAGCPSRTIQPVDPGTGPVETAVPGQPAVQLPEAIEYDGGFVRLTFEQAVQLSKDNNLPLLVYVATQWCGPCKELESKVFTSLFFQQFAKTLVSIKIDALSETGKPVAELYNVHSYPTMVVCRPGGEEIERFFGYSPTEEFVATVKDYVQGIRTASWYRDEALKRPEDLLLAFDAGRELAIRHRGGEALVFLEKIWRLDKENKTGQVPRALLLLGQTVYLDQFKDRDKALPILEDLSLRFPETYHGTEATYMIARIYVEKKDRDKARKILLEQVRIKPEDPIQYFRFGTFCLQYGEFYPEGIAKVREGIEKHPDLGYLWKTLADLQFRNRDYEGSVASMETACSKSDASESYNALLETYRNALRKVRETR
jgi:thioredoxin-related protein